MGKRVFTHVSSHRDLRPCIEIRISALKGRQEIAQGNALGLLVRIKPSPERAKLEAPCILVSPLAGLDSLSSTGPRALPWAIT